VTRAFNFSAGPAVLPQAVLEQAAADMTDWRGSGMSVMEMSHRGKEFISIAQAAEADLRALMVIPDDYAVLFVQGGATLQFSAIPLNLMPAGGSADYVDTGEWSRKAIKEAKRYGNVRVVASSADRNYSYAPTQDTWQPLDPNAAYVHYTSNETIGGVEFHWVPDVGRVPLVADMSSHILSRPVNVARYGLIYAGAQKNIGPAGLTVVIVRRDLLGHARADVPTLLDYKVQADADSMPNTPPTYAIYIAGLVFQWLRQQGGLAAMAQHNLAKAQLLYDFLDGSGFFRSPVQREDRSLMNIPFTLADDRLDAAFLQGAEARRMLQLKGHRSVGGMRASLYNAMPIEGVRCLVDYMREFETERA
jgi:phosphoserine aminotransferase